MCGHAKPHPEKYYEERVSEPVKLTRSTSILANTEITVRCVAQLPGDGYEFFFPVKDRSRTMDGIVVPRALGIMEQKKRTCSFKSPIQPRYGYFRLFNTTDWAIPLPYQGTRPSVNVILYSSRTRPASAKRWQQWKRKRHHLLNLGKGAIKKNMELCKVYKVFQTTLPP